MIIAYIDPGLGTLIWQAAVAFFVGMMFYLKKIRRAMFGFVRKIFGRNLKAPVITRVATQETSAIVETEVK